MKIEFLSKQGACSIIKIYTAETNPDSFHADMTVWIALYGKTGLVETDNTTMINLKCMRSSKHLLLKLDDGILEKLDDGYRGYAVIDQSKFYGIGGS